jgi:hypothetical protein
MKKKEDKLLACIQSRFILAKMRKAVSEASLFLLPSKPKYQKHQYWTKWRQFSPIYKTCCYIQAKPTCDSYK